MNGYNMKQTSESRNRIMGKAFIKVKNSIIQCKRQHFETVRNLVNLYVRQEPDEQKKKEIMFLYYDKLDRAQW